MKNFFVKKGNSKMTLLELLMALSILVILLIGLLTTFMTSTQLGELSESDLHIHNNIRETMSMLSYESRIRISSAPLTGFQGEETVDFIGIDALIRVLQSDPDKDGDVTDLWLNPNDTINSVPNYVITPNAPRVEDGIDTGLLETPDTTNPDNSPKYPKLMQVITYLNETYVPIELGANAPYFTDSDGYVFGAFDLDGDGSAATDYTIGTMSHTNGVYPVNAVPVEIRAVYTSRFGLQTVRRFMLISRKNEMISE